MMTEKYLVYGEVWFAVELEALDEAHAKAEVLSRLIRDDEVRLNVLELEAEPVDE